MTNEQFGAIFSLLMAIESDVAIIGSVGTRKFVNVVTFGAAVVFAILALVNPSHGQEIILRTSAPGAMAVKGDTLYVADTTQGAVATVNVNTKVVNVTAFGLQLPLGLATAADGNVYVSELNRSRISRINDDGTTTLVLQMATGASPRGLAAYHNGLLIGLFGQTSSVQLTSPIGTSVTDFAGTGKWGNNGDGLPALSTQLENPGAVAWNAADDVVYAAEISGARVRLFMPISGHNALTLAGNGFAGGFADQGGRRADQIQLNQPLAVDVAGQSVYIAEQANCRVDRVNGLTPSAIMSTTFATGCSPAGLAHDGLYEYVSFTDGTVRRYPRPDVTPIPTPSKTASGAPTLTPTTTPQNTLTPSATSGPLTLSCPLGLGVKCQCVP